jgi:hypothetical protein
MQWQTVAEGKEKDQWERIGCQPKAAGQDGRLAASRFAPYASVAAGQRVYTGPRGGRFTISAGGRKHYLGGG